MSTVNLNRWLFNAFLKSMMSESRAVNYDVIWMLGHPETSGKNLRRFLTKIAIRRWLLHD